MAPPSNPPKTGNPVTVSLSALQSNTVPFSTLLSAFGPSSLGILVVTDFPSTFPALRTRVLASSSRLAALPAPALQSLTNPGSKYLVGWSHGVETLRPGVVDTQKGSYYINCAFYQHPSLHGADAEKHPGFEEYTAPNVWPLEEAVPDFKSAAAELITLIIDVAVLVARACDRYAIEEVADYKPGYLEHVVKTSTTTKARLLHYFPTEPSKAEIGSTNGQILNGHLETVKPEKDDDSGEGDDWCATHLDHGCLTGLTSAMFVDESSTPPTDLNKPLSEIPSPSPQAGLYIRSRQNETVKVNIPRNALAFQTGEALELITKGKFRAVPHFVRGAAGTEGQRVARNTLAVFTQPNLDEIVDSKGRITFGEFARGVVRKNTKTDV
jgi:isopenicillin N synthase-like dioxygenase